MFKPPKIGRFGTSLPRFCEPTKGICHYCREAEEALRPLAKESELNDIRVAAFGIRPEAAKPVEAS
jgi:hypothetical protein